MRKESNFSLLIIDDALEKEIFDQKDALDPLPTFNIDWVPQGQDALKKVALAIKKNRPYSLVFMGFPMLQDHSGLETIKQIVDIDKDVQLVLCTVDDSDPSWGKRLNQLTRRENLFILKKPFNWVMLRQLAYSLTNTWQLMREARHYSQQLERKISQHSDSLEHSLAITRGTLESSADGMLVVDTHDKIVNFNSKLFEIWRMPRSGIEAQTVDSFFESCAHHLKNPNDLKTLFKNLKSNATQIQTSEFVFEDERVVECYSQPLQLKNEKMLGRIFSFRDITPQAMFEKKLKHQVMHDPLTGLPNQALLEDRFQQLIYFADRNGTKVGVFYLNVDRFKLINDSLGHAAGDHLLQTISKRIKFAIRKMDTMARMGGDEFIIVMPNITNEMDLSNIAKKILDVCMNPFIVGERKIAITLSIGVSVYPLDGTEVDDLIRAAGMAMNNAKELGRNQCQFYTPALYEQSLDRLMLETELHHAIMNHELFLVYQPEFDLETKKLAAIEALARWNHPKKGLLLPISFIPLAEESGLIVPIGEWALKTACQQNKDWQNKGIAKVPISVNVSTFQFKQPRLVDTIKTILKETKLNPKFLEIEITENTIIRSQESLNKIKELSDLGIHITLDDFGTGSSSLNYLRNLPIERLKIDRSFIDKINVNQKDEVIIQAIITMAKSLNLSVIAEGVETKNQVQFLSDRQCHLLQGFYFSKPLPPGEVEAILKKRITQIKGGT